MTQSSVVSRQSSDIRPRPLDDATPQNGNGRRPLPTIGGELVDAERISAEVEEMGAEEAIAWAIETFGGKLGFAVSFQKTSSVIIDLAHRINPAARFFYIDTELLFPETYKTRDRLSAHFGIEFERFVQENPPGLRERWDAGEWGPDDECCAPRKVATMRRALEGVDCWVSGVRRVDSETRAGARRFVFEGRECGGHVGPYGSFPLWESMVEGLLEWRGGGGGGCANG